MDAVQTEIEHGKWKRARIKLDQLVESKLISSYQQIVQADREMLDMLSNDDDDHKHVVEKRLKEYAEMIDSGAQDGFIGALLTCHLVWLIVPKKKAMTMNSLLLAAIRRCAKYVEAFSEDHHYLLRVIILELIIVLELTTTRIGMMMVSEEYLGKLENLLSSSSSTTHVTVKPGWFIVALGRTHNAFQDKKLLGRAFVALDFVITKYNKHGYFVNIAILLKAMLYGMRAETKTRGVELLTQHKDVLVGPVPYLLYGNLLGDLGQNMEALQAYKIACERCNQCDGSIILANVATIFARLGFHDKQQQVISMKNSKSKNNPNGTIIIFDGDKQGEQQRQVDDNANSARHKVDTLIWENRFEDAIRFIETNGLTLVHGYVYCLLETNKLDTAEVLCNLALSHEPNDPILLAYMGDIHASKHDLHKAIHFLKQAAEGFHEQQDLPKEIQTRLNMATLLAASETSRCNLQMPTRTNPVTILRKLYDLAEKNLPPDHELHLQIAYNLTILLLEQEQERDAAINLWCRARKFPFSLSSKFQNARDGKSHMQGQGHRKAIHQFLQKVRNESSVSTIMTSQEILDLDLYVLERLDDHYKFPNRIMSHKSK